MICCVYAAETVYLQELPIHRRARNNTEMTHVPDEKLTQLLRATAQGDAKAFKTLYDETSPRLHAVALTMMRDPELSEDVMQDAFVQIWHRASDYHADRGSVFTWLTTIVRYRAIDLLRKRRHDKSSGEMRTFDVDPADIDYLDSTDAARNDEQSGPLANAIASEGNTLLRKCIDRLSNNQQRSVSLAFFRGFTHQELADCLAEPLGTIKSRLRRSLLRLKECLENLSESNEIQRGTS